jgi:phosphate transport system substrate-binding protein
MKSQSNRLPKVLNPAPRIFTGMKVGGPPPPRNVEEGTAGSEEAERFAREAGATGLVLPARAPTRPWTAVAIGVLLVVAAVEVGYLANDFLLQRPQGPPTIILPACTDSTYPFNGTVSSTLDPTPDAWLVAADHQMANATGGCAVLSLRNSAGDGFVPELARSTTEFAVAGNLPNASDVGSLPEPVETIPVALAAVMVVYNLPGVAGNLHLSSGVLAGIFSGTITSWNASAITSLNPGAPLTGLPPIQVVHRTDPTASTLVLTQFLADTNASWRSTVGSGLSVAWPVGSGAGSRAALLADLNGTPGAIGYVTTYGGAVAGVEEAAVEDAAGAFALPTAGAVQAAAASFSSSKVVENADWANLSFANATASGSYPLAQLVYVALFEDPATAYGGTLTLTTTTWVVAYLWWLTGVPLLAPLPVSYIESAGEMFTHVSYNGTQVIQFQGPGGGDGDIDEF